MDNRIYVFRLLSGQSATVLAKTVNQAICALNRLYPGCVVGRPELVKTEQYLQQYKAVGANKW